MKVLYVNNDGGGFADYIEIPAGTTVQQFFAEGPDPKACLKMVLPILASTPILSC
jgi:hypothetical protein